MPLTHPPPPSFPRGPAPYPDTEAGILAPPSFPCAITVIPAQAGIYSGKGQITHFVPRSSKVDYRLRGSDEERHMNLWQEGIMACQRHNRQEECF